MPLGLLAVNGPDLPLLEDPLQDEREVLDARARGEEDHELLVLGALRLQEAHQARELLRRLAHHVEVVEGGGRALGGLCTIEYRVDRK